MHSLPQVPPPPTSPPGRDKGLRLVDVSGAELSSLLEAARGCGRYPRLRFVLVADHVELPLGRGGALAADLMAGLAGAGPSGWPSNTLLVGSVSCGGAVGCRAV